MCTLVDLIPLSRDDTQKYQAASNITSVPSRVLTEKQVPVWLKRDGELTDTDLLEQTSLREIYDMKNVSHQ